MRCLKLLLYYVVAASAAASVEGPACERASPHAQPADNHYRLGVAGDPDLFLPGELYTISLQGIDSGEGPTPFSGFTVWVEPAQFLAEAAEPSPTPAPALAVTNFSLGIFQTYDAQSKLHDQCKPAIVNATAHSKTEIQVIWSAPMNASNTCVRLCARAGSSLLARKICAATTAPAAPQPPILEPCCACDEAKYEVTLESLWSRFTHPRDFPAESLRAHFSDVIGASHTAQYRVWQEGRVASPGLRRLAEDGATTALEKELKAESEHIRTIIKARGISWQQAGGASTFAVFRVDARKHLVSLAAKMAPSPDWLVGVSALELCAPNCTWRRAASVPLYPYDAGTDSGIGYTSRRSPTVPPAAVRALRPDWPRDPRSPFYSSTGEMRPFARLRLNRLRLYEKNCDAPEAGSEAGYVVNAGAAGAAGSATGGAGGGEEASAGGACATHQWGAWSACSVSCGEGRASRQRQYLWPARAYAEACRALLTDHRNCRGPRMHCRAESEYEPEPAETSGACAVSPWSTWSPCEGCGLRARTRHYLAPRALKRCHIGHRARTVMHQTLPCAAGPCQKSLDPAYANMSNYDWFFYDNPGGECRVSSWSWWSPCSQRCGRGHRMRTRLFVYPDRRVRDVINAKLMFLWSKQFAKWQDTEIPEKNFTSPDPTVDSLVQKQQANCNFTIMLQESLCDGDGEDCHLPPVALCAQPASVGHCRRYRERWFYDAANASCEPFGYTGCGGNDNNFPTHAECQSVCGNYTANEGTTTELPTTAVSTTSTKIMTVESTLINKTNKSHPATSDNEVIQNDSPPLNTDCEVSPWQGWGECFGDCDYGIKLSYRNVLQSSGVCPVALLRSRHCMSQTCHRLTLQAATVAAARGSAPVSEPVATAASQADRRT